MDTRLIAAGNAARRAWPLPIGHSAIVLGYAAVSTLGINDLVKTALGRRAAHRA